MSKKQITSLTDAQRAIFPQYVAEWTAIGLSTERTDHEKAEAAIHKVYACGGLPPPKRIVWVGSPLALVEKDPSWAVQQKAGLNPLAGAGDDPHSVATRMGPPRMAAQRTTLTSQRRASVSDCIYGQHDAGWLSFYAYMREVLGLVEDTEPLQGLTELAKTCGWCLPYENTCYASERHNVLHRDAQGRLHNLDGPAVAYPDGWGVYAVRGVRVPKEWVVNKTSLDPMLALTEPNIERRAAAALLIGWSRVLEKLQPTVVDVETSDRYDYGKLLRVDLPDEPGQLFLQVMCPTGRTMVLRVPPTMRTAREANAWTYGRTPEEFNPEVRT